MGIMGDEYLYRAFRVGFNPKGMENYGDEDLYRVGI